MSSHSAEKPLRRPAKAAKMTLQIAIVAVLALGLGVFVGTSKIVTLAVDGRTSQVQTFAGTVAQVVDGADIELGDADVISPARGDSVANGTVITVSRVKNVTVQLDGAQRTVRTTVPSVGDLVDELGIAASAVVSLDESARLEPQGSFLTIITPKKVAVVVDGKTSTRTTTAGTVGELIHELKLALGKDDRVSLPENAPVVDSMVLKVSRLDSGTTDKETETISFDSAEEKSDTLLEGETKVVQKGVVGTLEKSYRVLTVDGREAGRTFVSEKVVEEPVTERILIGTKKKPTPKPVPDETAAAEEASADKDAAPAKNTGAAAPAAANAGMWEAIAQCESGGNWSINSGNGYYGGLQFDIPSWLANGGGAYAPNAALATKDQQIAVANTYYAKAGLSPWGCAGAAG